MPSNKDRFMLPATVEEWSPAEWGCIHSIGGMISNQKRAANT